jgi:hypothetical protein
LSVLLARSKKLPENLEENTSRSSHRGDQGDSSDVPTEFIHQSINPRRARFLSGRNQPLSKKSNEQRRSPTICSVRLFRRLLQSELIPRRNPWWRIQIENGELIRLWWYPMEPSKVCCPQKPCFTDILIGLRNAESRQTLRKKNTRIRTSAALHKLSKADGRNRRRPQSVAGAFQCRKAESNAKLSASRRGAAQSAHPVFDLDSPIPGTADAGAFGWGGPGGKRRSGTSVVWNPGGGN